ncbi:MAG: hypothetical protein HC929_04755 [Leptolyngbyaceae cyanobacterium SM2_5_2]|nr:hypothetical protein [Leptolyngbyaceae cyanobacterium SM2_5_2]
MPSPKPEMTPLPATEPSVLESPTVASPQVGVPMGEESELPTRDSAPTVPAQPENVEKATGAKGLMNRFRGWQEKQRSLTHSTPIPSDGLPMDSVPIYQTPNEPTPNGNAPVLESLDSDATPAESPATPDPSAYIELPRGMPELIEPYLTQPHLTEPRTQALPIPPKGHSNNDDEAETDPAQEQPSISSPAPPSQGKQNPLGNPINRPYI